METKETRLDAFMTGLRPALEKAHAANPDRYAYPASMIPDVLARVRSDLANKGARSVNKEWSGFREACKALGIKHTYTAIDAYLNGGTS